MKNPKQICSCVVCKKEFSYRGIATHYNLNHTETGKKKKESYLQIHKEKKKCQFCKKHVGIYGFETHILSCLLNPKNIKYCLECKEIITSSSCRDFCSRSCSGKYNNRRRKETGWKMSDESKEKTSKTLKKFYIDNPEKRIQYHQPFPKIVEKHICKICKKVSYVSGSKRRRVTCGDKDCIVQASTGDRNYQNGSRKPVYFYNPYENKDVLLESSWEVEIAELLLDNDIRWVRPKFIKWMDSTSKVRRYFPDFYLPEYDLYLDPKNPYCMKIDAEKMEAVSKLINIEYGHVDYIKEVILSL